jgi:hypothetical protein
MQFFLDGNTGRPDLQRMMRTMYFTLADVGERKTDVPGLRAQDDIGPNFISDLVHGWTTNRLRVDLEIRNTNGLHIGSKSLPAFSMQMNPNGDNLRAKYWFQTQQKKGSRS